MEILGIGLVELILFAIIFIGLIINYYYIG